MGRAKTYPYDPDYAVHPGEILQEMLEARNMKHGDLAERCGLTPKTVSQIIHGKAPITPETAVKLERVLGISAKLWGNLETNYQVFQARLADRYHLQGNEKWIEEFPIKQLVQRRILQQRKSTVEMMEQLLEFLGVGSIQAWEDRVAELEVAFRRSPSFQGSPASVATWLRIGELRAAGIDCARYDKSEFANALSKIRGLTCEDPHVFDPDMKRLCARAGVALILVKELPKTHLSGATRWLDKGNKALIVLSLRHKSDDHFWFSFFHEAGHILLHGKKTVFLDEEVMEMDGQEEQANRFAANLLIPRAKYDKFAAKGRFSSSAVQSFASKLGIAPGIVVGRLQFDQIIPYGHLNNLKRMFDLHEGDD